MTLAVKGSLFRNGRPEEGRRRERGKIKEGGEEMNLGKELDTLYWGLRKKKKIGRAGGKAPTKGAQGHFPYLSGIGPKKKVGGYGGGQAVRALLGRRRVL